MKVRFRYDDGRDVDLEVSGTATVPRGWSRDVEDSMLEGVLVLRPGEGAEDLNGIGRCDYQEGDCGSAGGLKAYDY